MIKIYKSDYEKGYEQGLNDAKEQILKNFDHCTKPGQAIFSQDLREKLFNRDSR